MNSAEDYETKIRNELLSLDSEVRQEFLSHFELQIDEYVAAMGKAMTEWQSLDHLLESSDRALLAAIVYAAITLNILSLKLFLSGHIVAAGNTFRQGLEAISLALLCSHESLPMRTGFANGRYSTKNSIRDVCKHWKKLGLVPGSHRQLRQAERFYGQYSHVTMLTIASMIPLSGDEMGLYVGASFDRGKIDAYRKEIAGRVSLSKVFPNFIEAVRMNIRK